MRRWTRDGCRIQVAWKVGGCFQRPRGQIGTWHGRQVCVLSYKSYTCTFTHPYPLSPTPTPPTPTRTESASKGQGDRSGPDTEDGLVCIGTYNSQTSILSPASLSHSCNKSWEPGLVQQRETLVGMVWVLTLSLKMGVVTCGTILRYSWWWGRPGTAEGSRQKEGSEAASRHS